jgi:VWFA-related protein
MRAFGILGVRNLAEMALLAAGVLFFRGAPGALAQAEDKAAAASQAPAALKVESNLVVVRAVVRDAQGHSVKGLKRADFKLFDQGKEQSIAQFDVEAGVEGLAGAAAVPGQSNLPPAAAPGRFIALYFDDLSTTAGDMMLARDGAAQYLASSLQPKDRVAIFTTEAMLSDFTSDRKQIHDALFLLRASPQSQKNTHDCPELSDYQAQQIAENDSDYGIDAWAVALDEAHIRCPAFNREPADVYASQILINARSVLAEAETQSRANVEQIDRVVKYTAQMPGQRTVILVSSGFLTKDAQYQLDRVIDDALRSQVVVSSLDARGLAVESDISRRFAPSPGVAGTKWRLDSAREMIATDGMVELAEGTGGQFFHNSNDLKAGFGALAGHPEVYVLAFAPHGLKPDGKFHALKVTLAEKQKGYSIQARRGYFAPRNEADAATRAKAPATGQQAATEQPAIPEAQAQRQEQIREALRSKAEIAGLPVTLDVQPSAGQGETRQVELSTHVDSKPLHFHKNGERNENTLTFAFAVFDRKDALVQLQERHAKVSVLDSQLPDFFKVGIDVATTLQLKPGSYHLREVVTDSEEHKIAALSRDVDISLPAESLPEPAEDSTSGATLDKVLLGLQRNYEEYLSSVPDIFVDEHVVSTITSGNGDYSGRSIRTLEQGTQEHDSSTTDSIFRLRRTGARIDDLTESRDIKFVNHVMAEKGQVLSGPAVFTGAFSGAPSYILPQFKGCYDYRLLSGKHTQDRNLLVIEYATRHSPADSQCPVHERIRGRAMVDSSSMRIVRIEQERPGHKLPEFTVSWKWSIDYAQAMIGGKPFWLPKTVTSETESHAGDEVHWTFEATYSNYHLTNATTKLLPGSPENPKQ